MIRINSISIKLRLLFLIVTPIRDPIKKFSVAIDLRDQVAKSPPNFLDSLSNVAELVVLFEHYDSWDTNHVYILLSCNLIHFLTVKICRILSGITLLSITISLIDEAPVLKIDKEKATIYRKLSSSNYKIPLQPNLMITY